MVNSKLFTFVLLILFFSWIHSGCKKVVENKLSGTWSVVNIQDVNADTYLEEWTFNDAGEVSVYRETDHVHFLVTSNIAEYKLISRKFLKITGFKDATLQYYNYTWQIVYLTKNKLRIVNDQNGESGLMFKEFEKKAVE